MSVSYIQDIWSVITYYEVSIESFEQSIGGNLSRLAPDLGGNLTNVNVLEHLNHQRLMILIGSRNQLKPLLIRSMIKTGALHNIP